MRWTRLALLGPATLGLACYSYTPIGIDALPAGAEARLHVTEAQATALPEVLRTGSRRIEGTVIERSADGLLLLVPVRAPDRIAGMTPLHQRLVVPYVAVVGAETRRLDRLRTAALIGAGTIAVGLVVANQLGGSGGTPLAPPGGGGPTELLVPLPRRGLRLPLAVFRFR